MAGFDLSSSTAQSDQTSFNTGGNAGIQFGAQLKPQTMLIIAAVAVVFLMVWKK